MALRRHTHAWGSSGNHPIPQNRDGRAVHLKKAACTLNGRLSDKVQAAFGIRLSQNKRAAGLLNGNALCHGLPPQARVWRRSAMNTVRLRCAWILAAILCPKRLHHIGADFADEPEALFKSSLHLRQSLPIGVVRAACEADAAAVVIVQAKLRGVPLGDEL